MVSFDFNGTVVDDDDSSLISYFPPEAWNTTHLAKYANFNAGSYHLTTLGGAYMSFTFNGTYVAYYSDKNNDHGDFLVAIDGGEPITGNSYASDWSRATLLLYESPVLNPGNHTVIITNVKGDTALGLDYFVIRDSNSSTSLPASSPSTTAGNSGSDDEDAPSGISKGTVHIIAGFAGGVALCVFVAIIFWIRRCRHRRSRRVGLPHHAVKPAGPAPQRPAQRRPLPQPPRPRPH